MILNSRSNQSSETLMGAIRALNLHPIQTIKNESIISGKLVLLPGKKDPIPLAVYCKLRSNGRVELKVKSTDKTLSVAVMHACVDAIKEV